MGTIAPTRLRGTRANAFYIVLAYGNASGLSKAPFFFRSVAVFQCQHTERQFKLTWLGFTVSATSPGVRPKKLGGLKNTKAY